MKKLAAVISTTLLLASASANAQFYLGAKAGHLGSMTLVLQAHVMTALGLWGHSLVMSLMI